MMQWGGAPEDGKAAAMGEIQVSSFGALGTDPELAQLSVATRDAIAPLLAAYGLQARVGEGGEAAKSSAGLEVTGSASREGAYYVLRAQIARKPDKVILWSRGFETTNAKGVGLDAEAACAASGSARAIMPKHKEQSGFGATST